MAQDNGAKPGSSNEQDNIALARRFVREIWNARNTDVLDEFVSPDVVVHYEHGSIQGKDRWIAEFYGLLIEAIPDMKVEIEAVIAKGDNTVTRWSASGHHNGQLFGVPPSKELIELQGMDWARWVKGRVVEVWAHWDMSYLLRQMQTELKVLRGILPLCSFCKKIRNDEGYWVQVDFYIHKYSQADVSHSVCPECAKEQYPDIDIG